MRSSAQTRHKCCVLWEWLAVPWMSSIRANDKCPHMNKFEHQLAFLILLTIPYGLLQSTHGLLTAHSQSTGDLPTVYQRSTCSLFMVYSVCWRFSLRLPKVHSHSNNDLLAVYPWSTHNNYNHSLPTISSRFTHGLLAAYWQSNDSLLTVMLVPLVAITGGPITNPGLRVTNSIFLLSVKEKDRKCKEVVENRYY